MSASATLIYWCSLLAVIGVCSAIGALGIGAVLTAMHLRRRHALVIGAIIGPLVGYGLLEAVPLFA